MVNVTIERNEEEKRLKNFQKVAENWDKIPEYTQGKIDGMISTVLTICSEEKEQGETLVAGRG